MSPVFEPPVNPPLPPPSDEGSQLWEVLYSSLGFHRETDESTGFQLRGLCEDLMIPLQRVYDLVREQEGRAAGGTMLDPDNVPAEGLPYLAQYVGAKLLPNMSEQQRRDEIKRPTTWRRGETETIELVVKRELTGDAWIRIRPRTPGPGHIYIRTLTSETPSPARLEATLLEAAIPAWVVMDYEAIEGVSWTDVAADWESWEALEASFTSWNAITTMLPDELPEP